MSKKRTRKNVATPTTKATNNKKIAQRNTKRKETSNRFIAGISFTVTLAILITLFLVGYNDYLYGDTTKPDYNVNYEEALISDSELFAYYSTENPVKVMKFDPDGMENGIYSVYIKGYNEPFMYQGCEHWTPDKDLTTLNQQTVFTEFSKRENIIIKSARDLVCKYIEDSTVLTNKEELISRIQTVPFYKYKDTSHPELESVMFAPAVHMGVGIYCYDDFSDFFCEYMVVHELIHHLRYLTNGEKISNEMYFASPLDEALTEIITKTINPKLFEMEDYISGYDIYTQPMYCYLSLFKEEALEAYFYGYDKFFEKYGGDTFEEEHNAFSVVLASYESNFNSMIVCDSIFTTWEKLQNKNA